MSGFRSGYLRRVRNAFLALAILTAQFTPIIGLTGKASATGGTPPPPKVRICHRTASYTNPYVEIEVDKNAVDGIAGNSGNEADHYGEHQGPLFYPEIPKHTEWGDIIPPVAGAHAGFNWTTAGQAIYYNDCELEDGSITIVKDAQPNSSTNFEFEIDQQDSSWDQDFTLDDDAGASGADNNHQSSKKFDLEGGVYDITEAVESGWTLSSIICSNGAEAVTNLANRKVTVTLAASQDVTCTFTNQKHGSITIVKDAQPNHSQDFAFTTSGQGLSNFNLDDDSNGTLSNTKTFSNLAAGGTYTFTESAVDDWQVSAINCSEGASVQKTATSVTVTLAAGQGVTCTFINVPADGTLTIVKDVVNNNGGTKTYADFTFALNGGTPQTFNMTTSPDGNRVLSLPAGSSFTVVEPEANSGGYTTSYSGCSGTIVSGQNQTCTITNDDQPGTLIVRKVIVNDNGGIKDFADFSFSVNGATAVAFEPDGENQYTVDRGYYSVVETTVTDYTTTYAVNGYPSQDCDDILVPNGETRTCTITNDDIAPALTLIKQLVGNYNQGIDPSDWLLTATGPTTLSGPGGAVSGPNFEAGDYELSESSNVPGFINGSWSCHYVGSEAEIALNNGTGLTVSLGDNIVCTIINTAKPKVFVTKHAAPSDETDFDFSLTNNGALYANFSLSDGGTFNTGTELMPGSVVVSETPLAGWSLIQANCYYWEDDSEVYVGTTFTAEAGYVYFCDFYNDKDGNVIVVKFHDLNENGVRDEYFGELEPVLQDVTINLSQGEDTVSDETDSNGQASFDGLRKGSYYVSENVPEGWRLTDIHCGSDDEDYDGYSAGYNWHYIYLNRGETINCTVGNASNNRDIDLEKTNNSGGALTPIESIVTYTLILTNPAGNGILANPTVTDTPPTGFTYQTGTWTASSNLRGDLKASGVVPEPSYSPSGIWSFDGADPSENVLFPGEVVTFTYKMKIERSVVPGTHTNIAVAEVCPVEEEVILYRTLSNLVDEIEVPETEDCLRDEASSDVRVKGITIVLVDTGAPAVYGLTIGLLLIAGALAMTSSKFATAKR